MKNLIKSLLILVLVASLIRIGAASFTPDEIDWSNNTVSGTLYRYDQLSDEEYTVKTVQFSSPVPGIKNLQGNIVPQDIVYPAVYLEIYKSGTFLDKIVLNVTRDTYIDPDYEIKIIVTGFTKRNSRDWVYEYYNPWTTITMQKRALPSLGIDIRTDKVTYTSYDDKIITATVTISNANALLKNADVNLNIGDLKLSDTNYKLHEDYIKIDKDSSQSFRVKLIVPELTEETVFNLNADVKGYDVKGVEYNSSINYSITITPKEYLTLSKGLRDRIYLDDNENVIVTISNSVVYDISNITVMDDMGENFRVDGKLKWHISLLRPGQEWSTIYTAKPLGANLQGFYVPGLNAQFTINNKDYKTSSDPTNVVVNGPIIVLTKMVDKNITNVGSEVKVTVSINNIGDIPTRVNVKDYIPGNVEFVSGETSLGPIFLELNKPQTFSYIIRKNTVGDVQLPSAVANYTDIAYRDTFWSNISSENPIIRFIDPVDSDNNKGKNTSLSGKLSGKNDVQNKKMPEYGGIIGIITFIMVYMRKKNRI